MTVRLSVNLNKVALIRNSRGGNRPNLIQVAKDCEQFGADGITVHPRPDERHIRYDDLQPLKDIVQTEFNIEGYPSERFMNIIRSVKPHQCTLVPDPPGVLTSDSGWDVKANQSFLMDVLGQLRAWGVRSSLFLNPEPEQIPYVQTVGADRIELYTGEFAKFFAAGDQACILPHQATASAAASLRIGVNAGHDLDLTNLRFYASQVPELKEVSIGHALISDALYYGFENVVAMYQRQLAIFPQK